MELLKTFHTFAKQIKNKKMENENFGATPQLSSFTFDGENIVIPNCGHVDSLGGFWPLTGRINQAEIQAIDFVIENFQTIKDALLTSSSS